MKYCVPVLILVMVLLSGCTQGIMPAPAEESGQPAVGTQFGAREPAGTTPDEPVDTVPAVQTYSVEEVVKHNNADDCWLSIDGKIYDVTTFVGSHPGGTSLLEGCGVESTELFETRPMGSGTPHSQNAQSMLGTYYIGELEE